MEESLVKLLSELYGEIDGEHLGMGYTMLEESKIKYPELKYILDKVELNNY
jgi:hypothetical protein